MSDSLTVQSSSIHESHSNSVSRGMNSRIPVKSDSIPHSSSKKRNRRCPNIFGELAELDLSASLDDGLNLDDSAFDNLTFKPPEDKATKVMATIKRIGQQPSKRMKAERLESIERGPQAETQENYQDDFINLDDEFDLSDLSIKSNGSEEKSLRSYLEKHAEKNEFPANSGANNSDEISSIDKTVDIMAEPENVSSIANESTHMKNVNQNLSTSIEYLGMVTENKAFKDVFYKESLARISIIEDAMFKNGSLGQRNHKSQITNVKTVEEIRMFEVSNHLPLKNTKDLEKFEKHLEDLEFRKTAVIQKKLQYYFIFIEFD